MTVSHSRLPESEPEPEYPSVGWRGLGTVWAAVLGSIAAGGVILQILGPPPGATAGSSAARQSPAQAAGVRAPAHPAGVQPSGGRVMEAAKPSGNEIATLLTKAQAEITENPDGLPPGSEVEGMLRRVAAVLPQASPEDRKRANDVASDLFDRAKNAVAAGKVDEEQHWLALGSILAPPPELPPPPEGVKTAQTTQPQSSPAAPPAREDVTPNEAEANQAAPAQGGTQNANAPSDASSAASGTPQASVISVSLHIPASASPATGDRIKQLEARLKSSFAQTETHPETDVPRTAVIRYAAPVDHSTAKDVAQILGGMGYSWRIERLAAENPESASRTIDVWIPNGTSAPAEPSRRRVYYYSPPPRSWSPWIFRSWF